MAVMSLEEYFAMLWIEIYETFFITKTFADSISVYVVLALLLVYWRSFYSEFFTKCMIAVSRQLWHKTALYYTSLTHQFTKTKPNQFRYLSFNRGTAMLYFLQWVWWLVFMFCVFRRAPRLALILKVKNVPCLFLKVKNAPCLFLSQNCALPSFKSQNCILPFFRS